VLVSLSTKARKRIAFFGAVGLAAVMGAVAIPALAADDTGATVVAQIGADGGVTSLMALGGAAKPASNALPITLKVSATQNGNKLAVDKIGGAGGTIGLQYVVTNTTSKTQDINYTDPTGAAQTLKAELQVPYVAQLDVILPQGWSGVHATGGTITSMPDGSLDVRWSFVLFSPLGSAAQSVSLTASGSGKKSPVATLTARVVNPIADSTLATTGVDANSTIAQNGLLGSYADGAKSGLDQLADGATQLLTGLQQLADGANQLHAGLVTGADGTNKLAQGLHSTTGQPDLLGGSKQLAAGVQALSGGLGQLADTSTGLPAALLGVTLLQSGVDQLVAALGDGKPGNNIRGGVLLLQGGVSGLQDGVAKLLTGVGGEKAGVACLADLITPMVKPPDLPAGDDPNCATAANPTGAHPAITQIPDSVEKLVLGAILAGIGKPTDLTDTTLLGGLNLIAGGLSNPGCNLHDPQNATNPCGVKQGLALLSAGLSNPACDLANPTDPANPCGIKEALALVTGGLSNPKCDPLHPTDPKNPCGVKEGLAALNTGLTAAVDGANQLFAGSQLASTGAGQIVTGLGQESAGLDQLAAGLPAATSGSKQIADGLGQAAAGAQQIAGGQVQVRDAAVVPIVQSLSQGGGNAAGTLAVLAALSTSASKPPLGTGTTLILTQSDINPGPTWPLWLAIVVAAAAIIVGLVVGLLIGPRRRRHGA
jgi:putative membrane protein